MKRILTTLSQKWPEYLLEILVITIGIYGAFALDNWNENRKERITEQAALIQLKEEFEANLKQLDLKISIRENIMLQASEVLDYIDFSKNVRKDTLLKKISAIIIAPTFDPIENDILRSEKIQWITNDKLRGLLSNWPSDVVQLKEQEEEWVMLYNTIIVPYFIDIGISRDINLIFYKDDVNLNYLMDKNMRKKIMLRYSKNTPNVNEILSDLKLEGILSNAVLLNVGINWESEALRNRILEILETINGEIKTDEGS